MQSNRPNVTSVMRCPVLTAAEIQSLHELPDHGVNRAEEIIRFDSFETWMARGGAGNNFWMRFKPEMFEGAHREPQWVQRFAALYPDLDAPACLGYFNWLIQRFEPAATVPLSLRKPRAG